jgi:uncharacterized membrane protein YphA (DoxX/SURF4 family)
MGVGQFVESNLSHVPSFMPAWFGKPYLSAVPWAEVVLGALVLLGFMTRVSGFLGGLMLLSFAYATQNFLNQELSPVPLSHPSVYACFALILLFVGPGMISVDRLLFKGKR